MSWHFVCFCLFVFSPPDSSYLPLFFLDILKPKHGPPKGVIGKCLTGRFQYSRPNQPQPFQLPPTPAFRTPRAARAQTRMPAEPCVLPIVGSGEALPPSFVAATVLDLPCSLKGRPRSSFPCLFRANGKKTDKKHNFPRIFFSANSLKSLEKRGKGLKIQARKKNTNPNF